MREHLMDYGCTEGQLKYMRGTDERVIKCWVKKSDIELKELEGFFDEVVEENFKAIENNPISKDDDSEEERY